MHVPVRQYTITGENNSRPTLQTNYAYSALTDRGHTVNHIPPVHHCRYVVTCHVCTYVPHREHDTRRGIQRQNLRHGDVDPGATLTMVWTHTY